MARQMNCTWSWNPENRQFRFARSCRRFSPGFGGWLAERKSRLYQWHAPRGKQFGMDIYYFGHYTKPDNEPDFEAKFASMWQCRWSETGPNLRNSTK